MKSKFTYSFIFFILLLAHIAAGVYFDGYSPWSVFWLVLGYITLLVLGSIKIQWNFYIKSQNKLPILKMTFEKGQMQLLQNQHQIALTFDDGPASNTDSVLDILKAANVKATFFVIGKNIPGNEAIIKRMVTEGHAIGGHSQNHGFNFDWQRSKNMIAEIETCNQAISTISGKPVKLFRPPYGVTNPNLAKAIKAMGQRSIGWSLRSMDTVAKDKDVLLQKIWKNTKPRDIILLHDRCDITVQLLPDLIRGLRDKGYGFATLD